ITRSFPRGFWPGLTTRPCYPASTTFHRLGEMGARRPFFMNPVPGFSLAPACNLGGRIHVRRAHKGAAARAGADRAKRGARAAHGGSRSRAARPRALLRLHRPSGGCRSRSLRACHPRARRLPPRVHDRRLLTGPRAAASQAGALRALRRPSRSAPHCSRDCRAEALQGRADRRGCTRSPSRHRAEAGGHPVRADRAGQPDRRGKQMSREIIEFVQELERDKGIESDTLIEALEDALLAAYKKTPGASRYAVVELDREEGDFRVFSIELPPDIEERLLEEARERVLTE